ncbi:MAG: ATP-binding protein [Betaproteobacteria bacterium]|nr:ATP-binding protein [Betaproteobacteria bacterium]
MRKRRFWIGALERAWRRRSVVWLSGVRRAGKTTLSQSLPGGEYFDCELPRVRRELADPEAFLAALRGKTVVLDEIHRLGDPAQLLKIAADHFPDTRVLATGSSTLGASRKFRDTLAGRKSEIWLTPMMTADLADFDAPDFKHRFLRGGLPPFFLADSFPERDFQEWMDAYWAKDIQELFRLERRHSFQRFAELLFIQSGGMFEATRFARDCEVSRTTIANYLAVLDATFVVHVLKPFSSRRATEIIAAPKVYAFDTGFLCHYRGWSALRGDDLDLLWEHFVLNEIHARLQARDIGYWRDKRQHEIDFVMRKRGKSPIAIECKWSAEGFDARNLLAFRQVYPTGENFVVCQDVARPYRRSMTGCDVNFVSLSGLIARLQAA